MAVKSPGVVSLTAIYHVDAATVSAAVSFAMVMSMKCTVLEVDIVAFLRSISPVWIICAVDLMRDRWERINVDHGWERLRIRRMRSCVGHNKDHELWVKKLYIFFHAFMSDLRKKKSCWNTKRWFSQHTVALVPFQLMLNINSSFRLNLSNNVSMWSLNLCIHCLIISKPG